MTDRITWVLEPDVFSEASYRSMREAVLDQGHEFVEWDDAWWSNGRWLQREWRYVVADRQIVAGSAYAADGRDALPDDPAGAPWLFAADVAGKLRSPEAVYVMDICGRR